MKKFSILIFTIITFLTPIFFCNAVAPTTDTGSTTLSPIVSATSITSTTVTLKASRLSADDDIIFTVYDDAYNINLTKSINTGVSTFVTASFSGLRPGVKYNADVYDFNSDLDTLITFTTTGNTSSYTFNYTAGANGTIVGTKSQTVNYGASGTSVTATPNAGYHFTSWSDGSTSAIRVDSNATSNISVTANFAATTTGGTTSSHILTYTAGANGTIVGTTPQTVTNGSNGTIVTATPASGYHFTSWSDGVLTVSRTDSNVTSNISVTANFEATIDVTSPRTLTYTAGANGTIVGTTPQTVNYGASGTTVAATPTSGYQFTSWSDGSTSSIRTDSNVTSNISVTANFEKTTLNFVDLITTINSAISRIKNNIEGTSIGNYSVGSIAELRKVVDEKYDSVAGTFLPDAFANQTQIDAYNKKLNDAIVLFEARRVGGSANNTDLSSKKGGLVPACPSTGCGFDQLMTLINNVITFLLFTVATPLAAIIIAYAGWLYLSSGGNSSDVTKAKKILMNVVIGYVIGLAAWLIVKTIITSLGVDPSINTFLK